MNRRATVLLAVVLGVLGSAGAAALTTLPADAPTSPVEVRAQRHRPRHTPVPTPTQTPDQSGHSEGGRQKPESPRKIERHEIRGVSGAVTVVSGNVDPGTNTGGGSSSFAGRTPGP